MPHFTRRRTLTMNPDNALATLTEGLPTIKDVEITAPGNPMSIHRKRRVTANRWAMDGTIGIDGQELTITIDGVGNQHGKFADEILALLPEDAIDDHGMGEALAKMDKSAKFFGGAELPTILDDMRPGERVTLIASGNTGKSLAVIVLTTTRVLIKDRGLAETAMREIDPTQITSITTGKKLKGESVELTVSGSSISIEGMMHGRGTELANAIRDLKASSTSAAAPVAFAAPAAAAPVDAVEQVAKLAELHAAGVLTDEEFAAAKAKALGL